MFTLIAENERKEKITLTGNPAYVITEISGLDPSDAAINTVKTATADGTIFNSSTVNQKNIVITLAINSPAEDNRINLYKYFKSKRKVRLYYKNGHRDTYIDGYVEKIEVPFFEQKQTAQISIICPKPYFLSVGNTITDFSSIEDMFTFPFSISNIGIEFSKLKLGEQKSIINEGDVMSGIIIELRSSAKVINPGIYNVDTNEFFILDFEMAAGDKITINTNVNEKGVYILRDGVESSLIGKLRKNSSWFQLSPGDNVFTYDAEDLTENLECTFTMTNKFEGV